LPDITDQVFGGLSIHAQAQSTRWILNNESHQSFMFLYKLHLRN